MPPEKERAAWQGSPTRQQHAPPVYCAGPVGGKGGRLSSRRVLLGRIAWLNRVVADLEADRNRLAGIVAELLISNKSSPDTKAVCRGCV